jgi:hypothetical protein
MAQPYHCLYCFESLTARLEDRKQLSLSEVEALYSSYKASSSDSSTPAGASSSSSLASSGLSPASAASAATSDTSVDSTAEADKSKSNGSLVKETLLKSLHQDKTETLAASVEESPLFVTWNTIKVGGNHLRGCIGTFTAMELSEGLKDYALIS